MRYVSRHCLLFLAMSAAVVLVSTQAPAQEYTEGQKKIVSFRVAQVDALNRLADLVRAACLSENVTVAEALERTAEGSIQLRLFLRSARPVGEPRCYSDGVTEVDLEISVEALIRTVNTLCPHPEGEPFALEDLRDRAVDGRLRVSGRGRAPEGLSPEAVGRIEAAMPDTLPEMFPVGWERVRASGRIQAARDARIRAYGAMRARLEAIRVTPAHTIGDLIGTDSERRARLDIFVRHLPPAGPPRMMPDGICEVRVATLVRDIIEMLKETCTMGPGDEGWREENIDGLSVRLKTDCVTVTGYGVPAPMFVRPAEQTAPAPLPDWAAGVLEARGVVRPPEQLEDEGQARLLAARSAKARAAAELAKRLDQVTLDDGQTVRRRALKDPAFKEDVRTFLRSAETTLSRLTEDGQWEVVLRLPLVRLYEFSHETPSAP
ncbi:MAG TPA: hypothetical protein VM219_00305 [Phycisphaerae bacterium]|nr:hypothetical protein [Phycisphaerae bacterium]